MKLKLRQLLIFVASFLISTWLASFACMSAADSWAKVRPKLVVVIVIDQFRADYISRFQNQFGSDGFSALIKSGAYFPYGEYDILQCMTGPGHATVLTGAYPYQMGIPINKWYDQGTHSTRYCVEDGDQGPSPKNLIGTTVGDELKNSDQPGKVISLALKDRAAILMGGHRANLAFWFNVNTKEWTSSKYYLKDGSAPHWLKALNGKHRQVDCDLGKPCGVDMTVDAFQAALEGESLGQTVGTDLVAVSFSSHDVAGHRFGPNADEMRLMTLAEDKGLGRMRALIQHKVAGGLKSVVFVLTGDHGVAPSPDYLKRTGIDASKVNEDDIANELNEDLDKKFGKPGRGKWVAFVDDFNFYLDEEAVAGAKSDLAQVEAEMKRVLEKNSAFAHVFTQTDYLARSLPPGAFERKILKTYYIGRSGHVVAIPKPFYINEAKDTATHLTGYTYDRTVPIVFSGFGIKNGLFSDKAEVVDIAPTLAFLMGILPPALSEGHVLTQALRR